ncbi:MAG: metalloregulator ArsR/SmtB family transcription factor [Candidatus Dormibacteraeota bacterium]|nr:metalloregulator ArsR/SmtB family transcription factor [Candidatus Dormibacteraeota bacterium]
MDEIFKALSDPSRRRLLDRLNERNGQSLTDLCEGLDMARQSVTKHLAVLEAATLVATVRRGREKLHYLNPAPINDIAERWINQYHGERVRALSDLKRALEDRSMTKPEFVYISYIKTTPEELWRALTEPAFTQRYWGIVLETDWQKGSTMSWEKNGARNSDPEQTVLEADPYRHLAYTWHAFTPEWSATLGISDEVAAKLAAEPRSQVSFDLEEHGELVKLTVIHDHFEPGSAVAEMVTGGWPMVLSALKTLLETGDAQPVVS